eukprot:5659381-Pyramimonas_sp.AAC.1
MHGDCATTVAPLQQGRRVLASRGGEACLTGRCAASRAPYLVEGSDGQHAKTSSCSGWPSV